MASTKEKAEDLSKEQNEEKNEEKDEEQPEERSAVEAFFFLLKCEEYDRDLLLDPKEHHYNRMVNCIVRFLAAERPVGDANYDFIRSWLPDAPLTPTRETVHILNHLIAQLAMSRPVEGLQDNSMTTKAFRFYRWVAQGRNEADQESFENGDMTMASLESRQVAAALPTETPESCARCKVQFLHRESTMITSCTRCAILDASTGDERRISCVYWCSSECKRKHKNNHKKTCDLRRGLFRAAGLFQRLMYKIEVNGSRIHYRDVTVQNGVTCLEIMSGEEMAFRGMPAVCSLGPTEASMGISKEAFDGAVMFDKQREVMSRGRELLELLIRPFCRDIKIFSVSVKNAVQPVCGIMRRIVRHKESFNMLHEHCVFKLTLKSGEEMVLDITGLQFGWPEPIAPWDNWCKQRTLNVGVAEILSSTTDTHSHGAFALVAAGCSMTKEQERVREVMARILGKVFETHTLDPETNYLDLPIDEFEVWERGIFSEAAHHFREFSNMLRADGKGLVYFEVVGDEWQYALTESEKERQALQSSPAVCWYTEKEMEIMSYDREKLAVYWRQRCNHDQNQDAFRKLGMKMAFTSESMHSYLSQRKRNAGI